MALFLFFAVLISDLPQDPRGAASGYWPPYSATSFWNTPLPVDPPVHPESAALLNRIAQVRREGALTSDVTQNSYPIYLVDSRTPLRSVALEGYFSYFKNFDQQKDGVRFSAGSKATIHDVPIPSGVRSGGGRDAQVILWDPVQGTEWAFWRFKSSAGGYQATNGYRYDTRHGTGRLFGSGRGSGVSKLGGVVSAYEAETEGAVRHAVAFGYATPSAQWVYPATRSDGTGQLGFDLPQGARIQLDPTLTEADFVALGLGPAARAIARALQRYGLILIDRSGRPKAFLESEATGDWEDVNALEFALAPLTRNTQGRPDWSRFRVIDWEKWTGGELGRHGP